MQQYRQGLKEKGLYELYKEKQLILVGKIIHQLNKFKAKRQGVDALKGAEV